MSNITLLVCRCSLRTLHFVLILLFSNMSFANLHHVANTQYRYADDDIRDVINNRIGYNPSIYISPAIPIDSDVNLVDAVATECIDNVHRGKISLIPVNYNNAHWTAAVLRTDATGAASLYFNDPTGEQYRDAPLINRIMVLMQVQLHDLKVRQQNDGTSCGAFTAEDLIALARVNSDELTLESAQILLSSITDAGNLRKMHAQDAGVIQTQQAIVNTLSTFGIQNPDNGVVEPAEKLVYGKADSAEIIKIANDDAAVANKTKQEKFLLFVANLAQVAPDKAQETIQHLADQGTRTVSVANIIHESVSNNINNHLSGSNIVAVAAGDEETSLITKEAVWVAGTFGSSTQGEYKGNASYNGKVSGGTIGGDLYIGENNIIGLAYSHMHANFKFKGSNIGDKLSANGNIMSLYGQQQFGCGFILQEILSASSSKVSTKHLRPSSIALGKFTSKAYAIEAKVGYQFTPINSINLIPNFGIKYNHYKDSSYTETGAGVNNIYVMGKSDHLVTGIVGIKLTAPQQLSHDTQIIPGLHASVEHSLNNKQPHVKARLVWADNYFENNAAAKIPKTACNVGVSMHAKHKNVEMLAIYSCNLRSKYQGHQGLLKLKLLF